MSMSLRDQLLQAGLISQKQANDAERQQQRQAQQQRQTQPRPKHARSRATESAPTRPVPPARPVSPAPAVPPAAVPTAARAPAVSNAQAAKLARDLALNRKQQEKAQKKALQAQIKQLVEQNRIPPVEGDEHYNFVDGNKIRRITVNAALRGPLSRGEIVIVRHVAGYDLVPSAIAARIRERDASAVIAAVAQESAPADEAYPGFVVPDDLVW